MGFLGISGKNWKNVGKWALRAAPIVAAPFTGGASLLTLGIGAGAGAAGGALGGGGLKGALLGGGLGAIPGGGGVGSAAGGVAKAGLKQGLIQGAKKLGTQAAIDVGSKAGGKYLGGTAGGAIAAGLGTALAGGGAGGFKSVAKSAAKGAQQGGTGDAINFGANAATRGNAGNIGSNIYQNFMPSGTGRGEVPAPGQQSAAGGGVSTQSTRNVYGNLLGEGGTSAGLPTAGMTHGLLDKPLLFPKTGQSGPFTSYSRPPIPQLTPGGTNPAKSGVSLPTTKKQLPPLTPGGTNPAQSGVQGGGGGGSFGDFWDKYGNVAGQVGGAVVGGVMSAKAQRDALKRSPEELENLAGAQGAAGALGRGGESLFSESRPYIKGPANYYQALLKGNRAAMTQAVAPAMAQVTGAYRGAQSNLNQQGVRGAQRDVASGELARDQASKIAGLVTGVQPYAADSLAKLGTDVMSQAGPMMANAGNIYGDLLHGGLLNRTQAAARGERAGQAWGGLVRDIGEAIPTGKKKEEALTPAIPGPETISHPVGSAPAPQRQQPRPIVNPTINPRLPVNKPKIPTLTPGGTTRPAIPSGGWNTQYKF